MKYYLIKAEETSNGLIETLGELGKNKVVELTKEELEIIQVLGYDVGFCEDEGELYNNTCKKIRKTIY